MYEYDSMQDAGANPPASPPINFERFSLELVGFRPGEIDRLYAYRGAVKAGVYSDNMLTCLGCGEAISRDWTPTDPSLASYHAGCRPDARRIL